MRRTRLSFYLLGIGIAATSSTAAQSSRTVPVSGVVVDSLGVPIAFANVILPDGRRIVATEGGRFGLNVDSAARSLEIRRIGFRPRLLEVAVWPDTALRIVLAPLARTLTRVRVEAHERIQSLAIHGFYERQAELEKGINNGFFITPEELELRAAARVTDFISNHPGVRVKLVRENGPRWARTGLQPQGLDGCRMEIYVDGVRFYSREPKAGLPPGAINFINDFMPTSNIAGMEVYPRSVTAPPRYQPFNGTCGVMLIWTK